MGCCASDQVEVPFANKPIQQQTLQPIVFQPQNIIRQPPKSKSIPSNQTILRIKSSKSISTKSTHVTLIKDILQKNTKCSPYATIAAEVSTQNPQTQYSSLVKISNQRLFESIISNKRKSENKNYTHPSQSMVNSRYSSIRNTPKSFNFRKSINSPYKINNKPKQITDMIFITHSNPKLIIQDFQFPKINIQSTKNSFAYNIFKPQKDKSQNLRQIIRIYSKNQKRRKQN